MTHINLTFNPYQELLTIQINDVPISPYSLLKKLEMLPFFEWSKKIFDIVDQEVNDAYEVRYYGQLAEYEILKYHAKAHEDCQKITRSDLPLFDVPKKRLNTFERLLRNGSLGTLPRKTTFLNLCTNGFDFSRDYPKLSFNRIKENLISFEEMFASNNSDGNVLVLQDNQFTDSMIEKIKKLDNSMFCIVLGTNFECLWAEKDKVCFSVSKQDLTYGFTQILNLRLYPDMLKEALRLVDYKSLKRELDELQILDKVEPGVKVNIPRIVEVGRESPITVSSIPIGYTIPNVIYEYSDSSLIHIAGNTIRALDEGVVYVTAVNAETGAKISTPKPVTCLKHKYLEKITLDQKNIVLRTGENFKLRLTYTPADADNISNIRYQSSDSLVAYAEKGIIYAKHDGDCEITISCENIKVVCYVEVKAPLTSFDISPTEMRIKKGDVAQFKITQHPANTLPEKYVSRAYPEGIVNVDINGRMIQGVSAGSAFVQIRTDDGKLSKNMRVTVIEK